MSVQTLLQSAMYKFGASPDHQRFSDDFYSALNNAQNDFAITRSWGFLRTTANLTTVASTRTVAVPSNFGKPYNMRGAMRITSPAANSGTEINLVPYEQWLSSTNYEDGTSTDVPAYAYILGSSFYFSPIPNAAFTIAIIYYKIPTNIADSSTAITIPAVYEEVLRKMIFRRLQDDGYSSVQELSISDNDIARLMNNAARDDVRRYGGMVMNLDPIAYKRSTT